MCVFRSKCCVWNDQEQSFIRGKIHFRNSTVIKRKQCDKKGRDFKVILLLGIKST